MIYYVLGFDGPNLIVMSQKKFDALEEAQKYANDCHKSWRAFVVSTI